MGKKMHTRRQGIDFGRIEDMLDSKIHNAFTACFAPIQECGTTSSTDDRCSNKKSRSRSQSRQREAMRKMEDGVRKNVAKAINRRDESMLTKDEDATLLTELDMTRASSSHSGTVSSGSETDSGTWGSGSLTNLNTIGDETVENPSVADETPLASGSGSGGNMNITKCNSGVKHIPGSYKHTVRSKFDYYRTHQTFGGVPNSFDPPSKEPTLTLKTIQGCDEMKMTSPSMSRNELAKQILNRRQHQPDTPSRSGFDP